MWKKALPILAIALIVVPSVLFAVHAQTPIATPTAANPDNNMNEQYPNYAGSIIAPEDATDQQLSTLTTISADQAKAAALKDPTVAGGTVTSVSLDDENGNVVYSVQIVKGSTSYDVKVDAGTGSVLFIDQGIENEISAAENLED